MRQCAELIRLHNGKSALVLAEHGLIAIFELTVLHQLCKRLREGLEVHQQLLVLLQQVKILL